MKKRLDLGWIGVLLICSFVFAAGYGWVMNIIKITQSFGDVLTGMFIARCIGVFVAPLGAVLGWF